MNPAISPSKNPRLFCEAAVLPPFCPGPNAPNTPAASCYSFGRLSDRRPSDFNLAAVVQIDDLADDVVKFHANLPREYLPVPPHDIPNPFATLTPRGNTLQAVCSALDDTMLAAIRLLLIERPESWGNGIKPAVLAEGIATTFWSDSKSNAYLALFIQEPWVLSPGALEACCSSQKISNHVVQPTSSSHQPTKVQHERCHAQRLLAFIHDRCRKKESSFFVVTSYRQWAFGCFNQARTHAFITPPYSDDGTQPTILQRLLHWMYSAMYHSRYRSNGYIVSEGHPWMNALYAVPKGAVKATHAPSAPSSSLIAEVEAWRQGARSYIRPSATPSAPSLYLGPTADDSPGRLRLPAKLQSPERELSEQPSERSGKTLLEDFRAPGDVSIGVLDLHPTRTPTVTPRGSGVAPSRLRRLSDIQARNALPVRRVLFPAGASSSQPLPRERRVSAPNHASHIKDRSHDKKLRALCLKGTISTLTDASQDDM